VPRRHEYECLFVCETLVDLALEVVDLQRGIDRYESVPERWKAHTKEGMRSRCFSLECQLERVARMTQQLNRLFDQPLMLRRVCRLRWLVFSLRTALGYDEVNTVGGSYEKAAAVWRSGVKRHDRVEVNTGKPRSVNRTVLGELSTQEYVVIDKQHPDTDDDDAYEVVLRQGLCLENETNGDDSKEE
jgi:hypothetical protein